MIAAGGVPSWGASTIRPLCGMTIPAPEPESRDLRLLTAGGADGSHRIPLADVRLPSEGRKPSLARLIDSGAFEGEEDAS